MSVSLLRYSTEELTAMLRSAQDARHAIITGQKPSYIAPAGVQRSYSLQNLDALDQHISELEAALAQKENGFSRASLRRPIHYGTGM
jgi:hypothetical protein